MSGAQAEYAPAKVNLALHVRARGADGYHAIETLFVFAGVGDTVAWLGDANEPSLMIDGPFAAGLDIADNLVLRAAGALAEAAGHRGGVALALTKRLPVASGIGGGSADAAATLRLLNRVWRLEWPLARLAELGATLGSDVPACVHSRPMRGEGRGERLSPVDFAGAAAVLVNPGVPVPTGAVFAAWDRVDRGALMDGDALAAAHDGRNDLEPPAIALAPAVADAIAALKDAPGASLARMSGSGATCFALFDCDRSATLAARAIEATHPRWWVASTRLSAA